MPPWPDTPECGCLSASPPKPTTGLAAAEHRSVFAYLGKLVTRDEAERVIRVAVTPEIASERFGEINLERASATKAPPHAARSSLS